MKLFKGRAMTFLSLGMMLLLFILTIIYVSGSFEVSSNVDDSSTVIEGVYSVDGGDWEQTPKGGMVDRDFRTLTVVGRLSSLPSQNEKLVTSVDNVWFKLKSGGRVIASNYRADDSVFADTPGYSISYVPAEKLAPDGEVELSIVYPYSMLSDRNLRDFFDMYVGSEAIVYELLFSHKAATIVICLLIMFFGLFAFPIAGIVLGKIDYRYLSFSVLCFFAGLFILCQSVYSYTPLWIHDPVKSLAACTIPTYLCLISALIYIKVNLKKNVNKVIGNIVIVSSVMLTALSLILHYTGVSDLYASKPFMLIFADVCAVILTVCLITEVRGDRATLMLLTSWIPIVAGLLLDAVNDFVSFTTVPIFEIGMMLTVLNQIVVLIIDLNRQYKESLRYQQMQKELYEAEVALMVSQIQPHFLYNSLTSIAMMCTKDPKKAREATINFADYLRGNMNSLKQKTPVPFDRELEHLKKYLMLEQMRFGELLNIEYDIQTTDFEIPQLSVQPLVENAVKHGVGMKEDGGTVTIATRETDTAYEVVISDDGVGFDTSKPVKDDGRSHVGMENVRHRLKELCDADVIIESEIDKGTVATIRIPKESRQ